MHVLQINKSLKQSYNNSNSVLVHSDQSELEGINKKHNEEIQKYIGQI